MDDTNQYYVDLKTMSVYLRIACSYLSKAGVCYPNILTVITYCKQIF
jgi:hypothetical protein